MSIIRTRPAAIMSAAALSLGLLAAAGAPTAGAAVTASARPAAAASLGACNILLEGQIRHLGGKPYICKHFPGVGYLWIRYYNSCGAATAPADRAAKPAVPAC